MDKDKNSLAPRLRFKEFSGEWEEKRLGNVTNLISERNKENEKLPIYSISNVEGFIPQSEQFEGVDSHSRGYDISLYKIIRNNTFAYNPARINVGSIGYSYDLNDILISSLYVCFKTKEELEDIYLLHFLKTERFNRAVEQNVEGGIRSYLFYANFSNIDIPVPSTKLEQQKIADTLSSLDTLIENEQAKLAQLQEHKKGLTQNLFPQEGENMPKVRFKEFENDGEWEEKKIKDFYEVKSSKRVLQKDWKNEGVPFYRTRELVSLSKREPFSSEVFISDSLYNELKKTYGIPEAGDFLVSGVGTLGICYQVKEGDIFYFKDGNVLWFNQKGDIFSSFFKHSFESSFIQNQIIGQASKSTVGTYTITNAKQTVFCLPPNVKEQQKIADTLSSLDDLISAQTKRIELLQQHKKGLMQGMFPSAQ